jgi:AraC-like DNA-binding protein
MKLNYSLDIDEKSMWLVKTPNSMSKSLPFYIHECGHYFANSSYYTERQGQDNYLLMYTLSGRGTLKYVDKEYTLEHNQAVVIHCDNYHLYKTSSIEQWNFKWVCFDGFSSKTHYKLLNDDDLNIVLVNDPKKFEAMLDSLKLYFDFNDIPANVNTSMQMTSILSELIINRFTPINNKKYQQHRDEIEKVINYIQLNYSQKIILDDLIKIAFMSKYYFLRIFKRQIGMSPYEYLLNYRINKAKELLKNTELSISEICLAVGFQDYNNFIREFKENVGFPPLNYKKHSNI